MSFSECPSLLREIGEAENRFKAINDKVEKKALEHLELWRLMPKEIRRSMT